MHFIIRNGLAASTKHADATDLPLNIESQEDLAAAHLADTDISISCAAELLSLYANTTETEPLYSQLQLIRDSYIGDLDCVQSVNEINGLIIWLLLDNGINGIGESLEETADRLSDLDIESDSDRYTRIIFHLKDAVDRLYELELD
ncbi:MAG: hypothetical protein V7731_20240 [Amphritea sp.]